MNSTQAAWLNGAAGLVAALLPALTAIPGIPSLAVAVALGVNAALHALLPDGPRGSVSGR